MQLLKKVWLTLSVVALAACGGEGFEEATEITGVQTQDLTGGTLSAVSQQSTGNIDLSSVGPTDWVHWGYSGPASVNRKAGVNSISNITNIGSATTASYGNNPFSFSWSGGTPTGSAGPTFTGLYRTGAGNGFEITAPADTTYRVLKIYVGVWKAQGQLEATLSDGSATTLYDDSLSNPTDTTDRVYSLLYKTPSAGQTLRVRWSTKATFNGTNGNVTLQAAALSISGLQPTGTLTGSRATPAAAVNLTTEGTVDWAHWGLTTPTTFTRKQVGSTFTSFTQIGTMAPSWYSNNTVGYSWTGGSPTATANGTTTGSYVRSVGNGFQLTVPADTSLRTLRLYLGVWSSRGKLDASLSDGSAPAYIDNGLVNTSGTSNGVYTIQYKAASAGKLLTTRWVVDESFLTTYGNVTLQAATLQ